MPVADILATGKVQKLLTHEGAKVKYSWRDLHIRNITITHLPVVLLSGGIIQVNRVTLCWWWW